MANLRKNLSELQSHLEPSERVMASVLGAYETNRMGAETVRSGILAATDRRLVFFAKKLTGYDMEAFPYSNISSFESSKGVLGHSISIFASGNKVSVKWIKDAQGTQEILNYVKPRIGRRETPQYIPAPVTAPAPDDPLKVLQLRYVRGEITKQEYEEMRQLLS